MLSLQPCPPVSGWSESRGRSRLLVDDGAGFDSRAVAAAIGSLSPSDDHTRGAGFGRSDSGRQACNRLEVHSRRSERLDRFVEPASFGRRAGSYCAPEAWRWRSVGTAQRGYRHSRKGRYCNGGRHRSRRTPGPRTSLLRARRVRHTRRASHRRPVCVRAADCDKRSSGYIGRCQTGSLPALARDRLPHRSRTQTARPIA